MPDVARPKRGSTRSLIILSALALVSTLLVGASLQAASAAPTCAKLYTSSISSTSPNPLTGGAGGSFTINLTNASAAGCTISIGSSEINVGPSLVGASVGSITVSDPTKTWVVSSVSGNTIRVKASGGTSKLNVGESVSITINFNSLPCGGGTFSINSTVWVATDFTASTFSRASGNPVPSLTVQPAPNTATQLAIIDVKDGSGGPLDSSDPAFFDAGSQTLFVKFNTGVKVVVRALDANGDAAMVCSPINVTLRKGTDTGPNQGAGTIPAGAVPPDVSISFTAGSSAENFKLFATATGLTADSINISVQSTVVVQDGGSGLTCISTGSCTGSTSSSSRFASSAPTSDPCDTTPGSPTCVTVLLPDGTGSGVAFLALGSCDGVTTECHTQLITFLANLKTPGAIYTPDAPFTMIVQCDRTACSGGGVPSYTFSLDVTNTGTFVPLPACVPNNHEVIDPSLGDVDGCTDYVASHRDNAQDLTLFVRLAFDARGKN